MAIAISNLGRGATTNATSLTSDSVTSTTDALVLASINSRTGITENPVTPTLSGLGLTWVKIAEILYDAASSSRRKLSLWRGMGSGASGTLVADFGAQTQTTINIIIDQATGVDTSGTNGSGAIVQSQVNSTASNNALTVTLGAFSSASNATFGTFGCAGAVPTEGGGFTPLHIERNTPFDLSLLTEFNLANDTTVDATFNFTEELGGIAIEIGVTSGSVISGTTVWGHDTGVTETNIRDFTGNWTGTGVIELSGDAEVIKLNAGEYMESEVVNTGATIVSLLHNTYAAGDTVLVRYRMGATQVACEAASYGDYSTQFTSDGYVQIRLVSTL